jgi:hypothetical protein
MSVRRTRLLTQLLDVFRSASAYLTADELSTLCDGDHSAKRVVRYILILEGVGYRFDTRRRRVGGQAVVNEYRLIGENA